MKSRHGAWTHPFMIMPKAGDREIRMRPAKMLPLVRGERVDYAEK